MEEPIWLIFGIIIILVAIGIIVGVVTSHQRSESRDSFFEGLKKLKVQCDFVCGAAEGNLLSIPIVVPSEARIYSSDKRICLYSSETSECERCSCTIEPYDLNLGNISIGKRFKKHTYDCFFEKLKDSVRMECKG